MIKGLLLAAAAIVFMGCEHGIDMEGTVVAPPEVQEQFSAEAPGQLFVVAKLPAEPHELRGDTTPAFCMPVGEQRSISVTGFRFACAQAAVAQVEAYVVPSTTDFINCADGTIKPRSASGPDTFDPADARAVGKVDAPVQIDGGGCADGHIRFTLTLSRVDSGP